MTNFEIGSLFTNILTEEIINICVNKSSQNKYYINNLTKGWCSFGLSIESNFNYSSYEAVWRITKLIVISYEKCLLLEIEIMTESFLFRIKYVIDGGCLIDY